VKIDELLMAAGHALRSLDERLASSGFRSAQRADQPDPADLPQPVDAAALDNILSQAQRPLVLHHWATWCDGTRGDLSQVVALQRALRDRADLVGLNWESLRDDRPREEQLAHIARIERRYGIRWRSLYFVGDRDELSSVLGIDSAALPLTTVHGGVPYMHRGPLTPTSTRHLIESVRL